MTVSATASTPRPAEHPLSVLACARGAWSFSYTYACAWRFS
jgi:hypothetical protein